MLIFGLGYTATRLAARLKADGWRVTATRQAADGETLAFSDEDGVRDAIGAASHILSSAPPAGEVDPVLARYGALLGGAPALWIGYLSSTGVYGDCGGAWVDETAPIGSGRRSARAEADLRWGALRPDVRRFRLPGIYGPGRSALDRVRAGQGRRVAAPGQMFSRIHVDDIVEGVVASFQHAPGIYNLADDQPAHPNAVTEEACRLLGQPLPPILSLEEAALSPAARAFYTESRRVANGRAKRILGWKPRYPTFHEGLRACLWRRDVRSDEACLPTKSS